MCVTLLSTHSEGIYFSSIPRSDRLLGPPSLVSSGYRALSPRVKRQGCKADHSPQSDAEVKNASSYTSTPTYVCIARCLIKHRIRLTGMVLKHRDNFATTFSLYPSKLVILISNRCMEQYCGGMWTEQPNWTCMGHANPFLNYCS
jgi:hypothetical protein